jgi:hypothetical protein
LVNAPKLFRRTKRGRKVGNWFVRIKGAEVNLCTQDAQLALRRREEAIKPRGPRSWPSDVELAAADTVATLNDSGTAPADASGSPTSPVPPAPAPEPAPPPAPSTLAPAPAPAPAPPAPPAPPPPAPTALAVTPVAPDGYAPPPPPPESWADAANAAATAPPPQNDNAGGVPPPPPGSQIDPTFLSAMLGQAADMIVELQLLGQGWLARRWASVDVAPVPPSFPMRQAAREAWRAQLLKWVPVDLPVPEWVLAVILTAACAPVQLAGATPIKKDDKPTPTTEAPTSSTTEAAPAAAA